MARTTWNQFMFLLQSLSQISLPEALVPGFEGIAVIFYFPIAFIVLAVVVPLVLHLNHRLEVWRRRSGNSVCFDNLSELAVTEGLRAVEKKPKMDEKQTIH